ncbi:MAG TPA: ATP-dependent DNA helicase, partial [Burkholderiaceae bacterium]|nr:ATP-dependent DNA helicase [Burkholderiaceae bacterium]
TEILPARVNEYEPASLDELSRAGRVVWTRVAPLQASGSRAPAPVRTTPIVLAQRRNLAVWTALASERDDAQLGSGARKVFEYLDAHGASFFDDIAEGCSLLRAQLEEALAELVANGLAVADSFAGLRALLVPSERRRPAGGRRRPRRTALFGIEDAGRWSLTRRRSSPAQGTAPDVVEHVARGLLRRYGVVFWHLVAREARWLPPWRELLRCYRRLEARGEIRGGRFVAGLSGEQFAAPEAIGSLREVRRRDHDGVLIGLSGADPLNLVGVLSPGARVPSLTGNRVLYRDGIPIAVLVAGEVRYLDSLSGPDQWAARDALLRRHVPSSLLLLG